MQWIRHGTYKELLVIFTTWVQLTFFWDVTLNEGKVGKSYIFYGRNSHHLAYGFHALDIFPWGPKYWIGHFIFTSRKFVNERTQSYLPLDPLCLCQLSKICATILNFKHVENNTFLQKHVLPYTNFTSNIFVCVGGQNLLTSFWQGKVTNYVYF